MIGRHLTLNNLEEFTIVGFTDKKSPCIYAAESMFINMLANNGGDDYYDEAYEEEEEEFSEEYDEDGNLSGSAPDASKLIDFGLYSGKLVVTDGNSPDNDYEVLVDKDYKKSMKIGSEI